MFDHIALYATVAVVVCALGEKCSKPWLMMTFILKPICYSADDLEMASSGRHPFDRTSSFDHLHY